MSLTKKDKEEIRAIIREECGLDFGEKLMKSIRRSPLKHLGKKWEDNGIKSESTGLIIAPEDVGIDGETEFTWDEAMALEKEGKIPEGWRLPTRHEWIMIIEEFGQDDDGSISGGELEEKLNLDFFGDGSAYWSSTTANSTSQAYHLRFYSSDAYMNSSGKNYGYSVRCVKEAK